jgi:hypothetical protein
MTLVNRDWFEGWFANKGQLLQFVVALLAFALACLVAWPTLQANQLLAPGSLLYFFVAALVIISSVRLVPALLARSAFAPPKTRTFERDEIRKVRAFVHNVDCKVGDYWSEPGSGILNNRITVRKIVSDPELAVEIIVTGYFHHGSAVKKISDKTYLVPVTTDSNIWEKNCLCTFSFSENEVSLKVLHISHANPNSQTALLSICRVIGSNWG